MRCRCAVTPRAQFFGVGTPEVFVIGLVALVLFGPKGLADATRQLGQALRGIQPTIREIQDVGQDLSYTLQKEMGIDEIQKEMRQLQNDMTLPSPSKRQEYPQELDLSTSSSTASSKDNEAKAAKQPDGTAEAPKSKEGDIEQMRKASAEMAWQQSKENGQAAQQQVGMETLSTAQIEAELARRKKADQKGSEQQEGAKKA